MEAANAGKGEKKSKPSFWLRLTGQSRKRNVKEKTPPVQEITTTRADRIYSSFRQPPVIEARKASSDIVGNSTSVHDLYWTLDSSGMDEVHNDAGILFLNDKVLHLRSQSAKAPERHVQFAPTPLNKYYNVWESGKGENAACRSDKENVPPRSAARSILRSKGREKTSSKNSCLTTRENVLPQMEEGKLVKVRQMIIEAQTKQTPSFPRTSTRVALMGNQNAPSPEFNESVVLGGHVEDSGEQPNITKSCSQGGFRDQYENSSKPQQCIVRNITNRTSAIFKAGNKLKGTNEKPQQLENANPQTLIPFTSDSCREKPGIQIANKRRVSMINVHSNRDGSNAFVIHEQINKEKVCTSNFVSQGLQKSKTASNEKPPNVVHSYNSVTNAYNGLPPLIKQQEVTALNPQNTRSIQASRSVQSINRYSNIPTNSTKYVQSVQPTKSMQPVQPTKFTQPVQPTKFTQPVHATKFMQPVQPTKFTQPVKPYQKDFLPRGTEASNSRCSSQWRHSNINAMHPVVMDTNAVLKNEIRIDKRPKRGGDTEHAQQNFSCQKSIATVVPDANHMQMHPSCAWRKAPKPQFSQSRTTNFLVLGDTQHQPFLQSTRVPECPNIPAESQRPQETVAEIMNKRSIKSEKFQNDCHRKSVDRKINIITSSPHDPQGKTLPKSWRYQRPIRKSEDCMSSMADDECSLNCSCTRCAFPGRDIPARPLHHQINYFFPSIPNTDPITTVQRGNFRTPPERNETTVNRRSSEKTTLDHHKNLPSTKASLNGESNRENVPALWYEFEDSSCKTPEANSKAHSNNFCAEQENIYSNESLSKIIEKAVRETLERLIASNSAPMLRTPHKSKSLDYISDSTRNSQSPIYMNLEVYRSKGDGSSAVSAKLSSMNADSSIRGQSPLKCAVVLPSDAHKFDFSPSQLTLIQQTFHRLLLECGAFNRLQSHSSPTSNNLERTENFQEHSTSLATTTHSEEKDCKRLMKEFPEELPKEIAVVAVSGDCEKKAILDTYSEEKVFNGDERCLNKSVIDVEMSNPREYCSRSEETSREMAKKAEDTQHSTEDLRYRKTSLMQSQSLPDLVRSLLESRKNFRSTISLIHCCGQQSETQECAVCDGGQEGEENEPCRSIASNLQTENCCLPSRHSPDGWDKTPTTDNSSAYSTVSGSSCSSVKDGANNDDASGSTEKDLEILEDLKRIGMGLPPVPKEKKSPFRFRSPTKVTKFKAKDVLSGKAKLKLSLYHNAGLVTIHIMRAAKLTSTRAKVLNPYVKVSLMPDDTKRAHWRTTVAKGQRNPVFDEKFSFEIISDDSSKRLIFSVWHRDYANQRSELLGCMSFGLHHVMDTTQCINGWYRLLREAIGTQKHFAAHPKNNRFLVQNKGFTGIVSNPCLV